MKISYHKRFSKEGTCYNQCVSMKQREFSCLMDAFYSERALKNPRQKEYINGNRDNLIAFNSPLEIDRRDGNTIYLTLTQTRFFNLFMKLELKDRNTCIIIRK